MQDWEERTKLQLTAIEQACGIQIENRDEAARIIAKGIDNSRQILSICTSLNSWVARNKLQGEVTIPSDLLERLLEKESAVS